MSRLTRESRSAFLWDESQTEGNILHKIDTLAVGIDGGRLKHYIADVRASWSCRYPVEGDRIPESPASVGFRTEIAGTDKRHLGFPVAELRPARLLQQ